ncbi:MULTISPECIES: VOC family protein [Paenibacillus]|uniref:VOC family protein n=1 Tax=Paenibacillus TaxID=44249 RepID=UPI000CFC77AF|nr:MULTISPECIES: VOC family protein [unclassified Paenibacillus]PQZ99121.1 glyoxalase/bleomycin resistance/extradiol dioxygenase family protein [Paenibacillus sp. MYb63]PRA44020.1 glyoxalase/bleomycin resistance/extradiol dioxygenase family protein [Paenibacillus sp. MYb67]QZN78735.1 VOC family protein [Paenibacillus sp. DR312]
MAIRAKQIFVNLPVQDLKKSVEFFTKVGFEFDANFTDESATCMIIGENIYAMLLVEERFQSFISKKISNAADTTEVIVALSVDSREQVDVIVQAALDAGAKPYNEPQDHGFMYGWSFQDLDDHLWEVSYMDLSAFPSA